MIIVVTGMVGLDKKDYLEQVCRFAADRGRSIALCSVGDLMYAEAPDVPAGKILDVPIQRLNSLRRSAFKDILAKAGQVQDLIVNTHATFRWRHGLFPAADFDQMRQLKTDLYICLIDGIAALHHRLLAGHTAEHTLKDLIVWREEEIIATEMLRKGIDDKIPLYCLARGNDQETTETFYRLAFESQIRRAYLSFPMTAVVGLDDVQKEIALFRRQMKSLFICFDPGDLEESDLPHRARLAQSQGQDHVPVDISGRSVRLSTRQIQEIERDINSQTYARDFMLIDQSHMIISFIPTLPDGRAAISSGVERELQHAHEAAKEVYVIWPARQSPSVFVTQTATRMFKTLQEAMDFFARKGYAKP
jgi:adenylate kinase